MIKKMHIRLLFNKNEDACQYNIADEQAQVEILRETNILNFLTHIIRLMKDKEQSFSKDPSLAKTTFFCVLSATRDGVCQAFFWHQY